MIKEETARAGSSTEVLPVPWVAVLIFGVPEACCSLHQFLRWVSYSVVARLG